MLLDVEHLTKCFGSFKAVDDVSFSLGAGEVLGLVGPNGAGKSTTIHMLLGLISPSAGSIRIFGLPLERSRREILQQTNCASPYVAFPSRLTVFENLMIFARLYGVRDPRAKTLALLRVFEVEHLKDKPLSRLSSGELTRVGLCKSFLNDPKLLLMDEPTAYLDPQAALLVKTRLLEAQRRCGTAILYTSHNMADVEEMCARVVFLSHGRVIASGTPIGVTQAILEEERNEPALREVFLRLSMGLPDEVI